jgi:high affinity sulfate transporter 1
MGSASDRAPAETSSIAAPVSAAGVGIPPPPEKGVAAWLPGVWMLRHYRRAWLGRDVVAGLVLTSILVPAGMGYAEAAGLPAITGLYATIIPLLAYSFFGPSRIMVLGPDSALAALIAAVVVGGSTSDPNRAVALASLLAILTGLLCIGAGLAKIGFITDLLSKPVRVGYMNGIALTVLVNQMPKLFGFSIKAAAVGDGCLGFVRGVAEGRTKLFALAIGGSCLGIIFGLRAFKPKAPGVLVAVVLATLAVTFFGEPGSIPVVGAVPRGVPLPTWPAVSIEDVRHVFVAAMGIALVSFADTSVLSRTFAGRQGYRIDPNRELIGLGVANLAGGLFRGFPISSSASRTPVAESAGSKTQVTGIVGALAIALVLMVAPSLMTNLPTTALAAVVIAAAIRLFDFGSVRVFYVVRRSDFVVTLIAFAAVATIGVIQGIPIAVGVSVLDFVRRAWRPHDAVLGRALGVTGYHDVTRYPNAKQVPGLILFRWDAPLFFANADMFRQRVVDAVDGSKALVRWVVVAAEPITDVDTTAAETIHELDTELATRGVELAFAEMKDPVKDRLCRYGLHAKIGHDFFFPTVGVAVKAFLDRYRVDGVDWEEDAKVDGES